MNELTSESHPTCQLARLPKLRYLLGPDPPPSPPLPDRPPTLDGSRLPPALPPPIFWPKSLPEACLPGAGATPLPTPSGRRTPETRPPGVRGSPQGPPADPQGPPGPPRARRKRGGARSPGTHPPPEGRRRCGGRQRQPGLALRARRWCSRPHFSWCTTMGADAGPPAPHLPEGTTLPPPGGSWRAGHLAPHSPSRRQRCCCKRFEPPAPGHTFR